MNAPSSISKRARFRKFLSARQRGFTVVGFVCLIVGVLFAQRLEPGVRIEKVLLAGDTPALKFIPAGNGPHPVALLAHGYSGTKENLSWYGEALSAAGFICYSVDLPGHGESKELFTVMNAARTLGRVARSLGSVDIVLGHSMGGIAGSEAVRQGLVQPKLVIPIGADGHVGEHGPPVLLLVGKFDEFFKPDELKARTDAQTIVSPWSDHGLELLDPILIHAAVNAASIAVGQPAPPHSILWLWNSTGAFLALLGAFTIVLALPDFPKALAWARGVIVAIIIGIAFFLTFHNWIDLKPHLHSTPGQIIATVVAIPLLAGARKLRIRRGAIVAVVVILTIAAVFGTQTVLASSIPLIWMIRLSIILTPALCVGALAGTTASFNGSPFSGDVAMALVVCYSLFQLGNAPRTAPVSAQAHHFIQLDAASLDACAGTYEIPPDNVFRTGATVKIWRDGERMMLEATGRRVLQGPHEIFAESETNFFLAVNGVELIFIKNEKGEVTGFIHHFASIPDSQARKLP